MVLMGTPEKIDCPMGRIERTIAAPLSVSGPRLIIRAMVGGRTNRNSGGLLLGICRESNPLGEDSKSLYLGASINGLEEVRRDLGKHEAHNHRKAMDFAIKIDQKLNVGHRFFRCPLKEGLNLIP